MRAVYHANFAEDLDISNPETLGRCLESADQESAPILEEAESADSKAKLRDQTDEAKRLCIFGAPSFVVEGELFWGNDRLENALAWGAGSST